MNARTLESRLRFLVTFAVLTLGVSPAALDAQTVVQGGIGTELRFLGDTIWRLRDTTMTAVVFRADTITRLNFIHGKPTGTTRYLLRGDVSIMIDDKDGAGKPRNQSFWGRVGPELVVGGERTMIEQVYRNKEMVERATAMGMPSNDAPNSPPDKRYYPFSANLNIEQHLDTVRYIRGCAAAPPIDTTVYLMFASDSVRRLSPAPRTFDRIMVAAVRSDMSRVVLSQRVTPRGFVVPGLPGPVKWPCDKR
jgi:hypothetical protein